MMGPAFNATSAGVSSEGAWQGENPLKYAFPLLIIQMTLVVLLSRALAFLLKPFRQPKVVAEIMGGIVLGPSALGRCKTYLHTIFPSWSSPILETVSSMGLLFFLFLVGLELDINSIRRSSRRALAIAAAGILLPFLSGVGVVFLLRKTVSSARDVGFYQSLVFIGVALSITAFPVLARILAELKLLTTAVGEIAMAAAAFNDVAAWVLLALAVALSGGEHRANPLVSIWILLSGVVFVAFMMTAVRPVMAWIARRSALENRAVGEVCICVTLAGVLLSGFATDLIGIHSIFGAFVFGLTIPKDGRFAGLLFERIEDFVSGIMLPLYFASSGLKTDVAKIQGVEAWALLPLVIATACISKIVGTFVVAVSSRIPAREAAVLGVLMNTKGLVELIALNIGKEKKVLNDETFTILVLMALFTTFITTPTVMAIYKPICCGATRYNRRLQPDSSSSSSGKSSKVLRVLACLHGPANVPSMVNLIEMIRGQENSRLKLYVMQLVELTERPSAIFTALRARKNGRPAHDPPRMEGRSDLDQVMGAFEVYEKLVRVKIRPITAISALATMHEDVCHVAEEKMVSLVILPFHKYSSGEGEGDGELDDLGHAWGGVNQRVLANAPCSVGVLVDRRLGPLGVGIQNRVLRVCLVFFGGPDDREALELGMMMMRSACIRLTLIRFIIEEGAREAQVSPTSSLSISSEKEKELDEKAVGEFLKRNTGCGAYEERIVGDVVEVILAIGRDEEYELVVVGRGRRCLFTGMGAETADLPAERTELGTVGNILASQGYGIVSSVLVVQQHDTVRSDEMPISTIVDSISKANFASDTSV